MKNYRITAQNKLLSSFKDLDKVLEMEETEIYNQISISVYNHWLTRDEGNKSFSRVSRIAHQRRRNRKHNNFYRALLKKMTIYGYEYIDYKDEFYFIKFNSLEDTLQYMSKGETNRFCIVIPKIRSILISGFDDTNHLYYQNEKMMNKIKPLVKKAGLYMI